MEMIVRCCTDYRVQVSSHNSITVELAYELTEKIYDDVNMEKNPAYSVTSALDRAEDHQCECIPVNKVEQEV